MTKKLQGSQEKKKDKTPGIKNKTRSEARSSWRANARAGRSKKKKKKKPSGKKGRSVTEVRGERDGGR